MKLHRRKHSGFISFAESSHCKSPIDPMFPLSLASPFTAVLLTLSCFVFGLLADECPTVCQCKWKSGKEFVSCTNASLTTIPLKLGAGTQVIELTGNNLSHIKKDEFGKAELLNLQKIYLSKCRIKTLDRFAFRKLTNLVELDLSYNMISAVPFHIFDSISGLRELKLSGNPIQRIPNEAFKNVPQLTRLELSDCKLGTIEPRAFFGLEESLAWLKLDGNKLINIKSSTITVLRNIHELELADNPWNCTCSIRPLREWMLRQNIPHGIPPVCSYPKRLAGKSWDRLELDEFACVPEIIATETIATGIEGHNVTMTCRIGGVPEPRVKWLWKNRVIANLSGGVPYSNGKKMYVVHVTDDASNLTILTADMQDTGIYVCSAENKAGKVEASVTLAVTRKPLDNSVSGRVLAASIIVAALFILASCLVILCVCTLRRRHNSNNWQGQVQNSRSARVRDDSYEKIEMNHKGPVLINHTSNGSRNIFRNNINSGISCAPENVEIAVVGPMNTRRRPRRGEYRGVPSVETDIGEEDGDDEDEGGYEDEIETPTPTTSVPKSKSGKLGWDNGTRSSDDTLNSSHTLSESINRLPSDNIDLHIPRSNSYIDKRNDKMIKDSLRPVPDTSTAYVSEAYNPISRVHNDRNPGISAITGSAISPHELASASLLPQHILRKQTLENSGGSLYTSAPFETSVASKDKEEKNYPDLLEISSYSNNVNNPCGSSSFNVTDGSFCTLPRKHGMNIGHERNAIVRANARFYRGTNTGSDSQSPLLPDNRYDSSGGEGSGGSNFSIRRSSIDSYSSSYYPLSSVQKISPIGQQRSSSTLNLSSPMAPFVLQDGSSMRNRKNPSLPTSPVLERRSTQTASATPLLNILGTGRGAGDSVYPLTPSTVTGIPSTANNTYDYHAAQLERFLEEYRSLQEQLCKMKETCENIRQQEVPPRITSPSANMSSRFMDPMLYGVSANVMTPSSSDESATGNPKSILKNKTSYVAVTAASASSPIAGNVLPNLNSPICPGAAVDYGTDPPPYWLPRNTLLRKLSSGDFFKS